MGLNTPHSALFEVRRISVFTIDSPLVQQVAKLTELRIVASFPNSYIVHILSTNTLTDIIVQVYILSSIIYINIALPANTIEVLMAYCRLSILTSVYRNNLHLRIKTKRYYSVNVSHLNLTLGKLFSIVFYPYFLIKSFRWSVFLWVNPGAKLDCSVVVTAAFIFFLLWLANAITNTYYIALKLTLGYILGKLHDRVIIAYILLTVSFTIIPLCLRSVGSSKVGVRLIRLLGTWALSFLRGLDNLFYIESSPKQHRADLSEDVECEFICRVVSHLLSIVTVVHLYYQFLDYISLGDTRIMRSILCGFNTILYDILTLNML